MSNQDDDNDDDDDSPSHLNLQSAPFQRWWIFRPRCPQHSSSNNKNKWKNNFGFRPVGSSSDCHTTIVSIVLGIRSIGVDYGLAGTRVATTAGYDPTPLAILSNLHSTHHVCCEIVKFAPSEQASQLLWDCCFIKMTQRLIKPSLLVTLLLN